MKLSDEEKHRRLTARAHELCKIHGLDVFRNIEWKCISTKLSKLNEKMKRTNP